MPNHPNTDPVHIESEKLVDLSDYERVLLDYSIRGEAVEPPDNVREIEIFSTADNVVAIRGGGDLYIFIYNRDELSAKTGDAFWKFDCMGAFRVEEDQIIPLQHTEDTGVTVFDEPSSVVVYKGKQYYVGNPQYVRNKDGLERARQRMPHGKFPSELALECRKWAKNAGVHSKIGKFYHRQYLKYVAMARMEV